MSSLEAEIVYEQMNHKDDCEGCWLCESKESKLKRKIKQTKLELKRLERILTNEQRSKRKNR